MFNQLPTNTPRSFFFTQDMGLQEKLTFFNEDTVITIPVKLPFLLALSLDPAGRARFLPWKHCTFWLIFLDELLNSMHLWAFSGLLKLSIQVFRQLVPFSLGLSDMPHIATLPHIISVFAMSEQTS